MTKITTDIVLKVKKWKDKVGQRFDTDSDMKITGYSVAALYGISSQTVYKIWHGKYDYLIPSLIPNECVQCQEFKKQLEDLDFKRRLEIRLYQDKRRQIQILKKTINQICEDNEIEKPDFQTLLALPEPQERDITNATEEPISR